MVLSELVLNQEDFNLGSTLASNTGSCIIVGVSSLGLNKLIRIGEGDDIKSKIGYGEATATAINLTKIASIDYQVLAMSPNNVNTTTPIIKKGLSNFGVGAITIDTSASKPLETLYITVTCTEAGDLETARFQYTVSNSGVVASLSASNSIEIPNTGIFLTLDAGTPTQGDISFALDDTWVITARRATVSVSELASILDIIIESDSDFEYILFATKIDSIALSIIDGALTKMYDMQKYRKAIIECAFDTTKNNNDIITEIKKLCNTVQNKRIILVSQYANPTSFDNPDYHQLISTLPYYAAHYSIRQAHEPIDAVEYGAVKGLVDVYPHWSRSQREEITKNGGVVFEKEIGRAGWYVARSITLAGNLSDYFSTHRVRVMDECTQAARNVLQKYKKGNIFIDEDTGEADTSGIVAEVNNALENIHNQGMISGFEVLIPEGQNVLSTEKIIIKIRIIPLGQTKSIEADLAFYNPLLQK